MDELTKNATTNTFTHIVSADRARLCAAAPRMHGLLKELAFGYCPSCGCDLCNTLGCPTCTWMRATRKLLIELDGGTYSEPPLLEPDEINKRNAQFKK